MSNKDIIKDNVWNEQRLFSLDSYEHDYIEFKSSSYLVHKRRIATDFIDSMSKQVSAFSNGAGGHILIGIDDHGHIDGGVPTDLKRGGTRSWLEDIIVNLVSPRLRRYNVYEICADQNPSDITPKHAVYVIEIPESIDAPHQAADKRYYLRIAGKSRPMEHMHILDIIRRTRNPRMALARFSPYGEPILDQSDPRGKQVFVAFQILFANQSRTLAHHVGAEIIIPRPFVGKKVKNRICAPGDIRYTQRPGELAFFRYHPNPIFPGQELFFMMIWIGLHKNNINLLHQHGEVEWRIYADDAEAITGNVQLHCFTVVQKAMVLLSD